MITILGVLGGIQIVILIAIIFTLGFYVFSLIKLWKSNLNIINKIAYTLLVILLPVLGFILLILLQRNIVFTVNKLSSE
jgi:hypothetical protein